MATQKKMTLTTLMAAKRDGRKMAMLTCYDYPTARMQAEAGVDVILVGDTYGQVVLGFDSTQPVTMDQMITITAAVRRGAPNVFLVGDMPFLSYQVCPEEAVRNAGRFLAEGGADCVKLECDLRLVDTVAAIARAGIPAMAHLGFRPQSLQQLGGYRIQGKTGESADALVVQAKAMVEAGASAILLEMVPPEPARRVTEAVPVPVIGCGAGPHVDGHVVVVHDMLGYTTAKVPRFVPQYTSVRQPMVDAFKQFVADVAGGEYPKPEHCYSVDE